MYTFIWGQYCTGVDSLMASLTHLNLHINVLWWMGCIPWFYVCIWQLELGHDMIQFSFYLFLPFLNDNISLTSHARAWMQEKMYPELASASAAGRAGVGKYVWKYDDIRWWQVVILFFVFSDASAGHLLPKIGAVCFRQEDLPPSCPSLCGSTLTQWVEIYFDREPLHVFLLIRFHEIIKVLRG